MSYVSADAAISEPSHNHAWRADDGSIHATVRLGTGAGVILYLDSAEDARAIAAACTQAAEALDRLADGGQP
jgi:hypothetical protein